MLERKFTMPKTKTIVELRRELASKEGKLKTLTDRRSKLAVQLAAADREIAKLGGEGAPGKKGGAKPATKRRKKAKNKQSLADVLASVLKGKMGIRVAEAAKLALTAGYKSASNQFANIVSQALSADKRFKKVSRGVYALKGAKKSAAKKVAKKRAKKKSAKKN